MTTATNPAFDALFCKLTGYPPYPWQVRLFERFASGGTFDALDIPTGLGKTSVIAIWLAAHLLSGPASRPPMRLVYVVNRQTIVDQATAVAGQLRDRVTPVTKDNEGRVIGIEPIPLWKERHGNTALPVSTLRGALADNREWLRYPHRPAIIVGTVDMIGSRLLFDAYRAGRWTKSMHAGLLGQDSLLVHDEAHLSGPFQRLLEWITARQRRDSSPRPMRVMAMSATGAPGGASTLRLGEDDRQLDAVTRRIGASKRLKLHPGEGKLADHLAALAARHESEPGHRVIIFVRTPRDAGAVRHRLVAKFDVDETRIELLTGTIRGAERDRLIETDVLKHLLEGTSPAGKTEYLVSTSAGEVGADFDADHLVCDLWTLDAMIQRLGRVNRRGAGDALVDVVVEAKVKDDDRRDKTAAWLARLPAVRGDADQRLDASPQALAALREADKDAYDAAVEEPAEWSPPHEFTLDAWAMTSIHDDWPLALPLEEFLHGKSGSETPRCSLAWRDELGVFLPDELGDELARPRQKQLSDWFEKYPLRPAELVNDRCVDVIDLLNSLATRRPAAALVRLRRGKVARTTIRDFVGAVPENATMLGRFCRDLTEETLILPTDVGGLNAESGMIDPASEGRVVDVADRVGNDLDRWRVLLTPDADGNLHPKWLGEVPADLPEISTPDEPTEWTAWRPKIITARAGKPLLRVVLDRGDAPAAFLLAFRPPRAGQDPRPVELEQHGLDAQHFAGRFASVLLPPELWTMLENAALWHDLGKGRRGWQLGIYNVKEPWLAKSGRRGMNSDVLDGYRHEHGSLVDVVDAAKPDHAEFTQLDESQRDLLLHLIAAHHGRGRPGFPAGAFDIDDRLRERFDEQITPAAVARRYARLQRRFGHWGLAWYESLLMAADHAASRGDEPEDTQ